MVTEDGKIVCKAYELAKRLIKSYKSLNNTGLDNEKSDEELLMLKDNANKIIIKNHDDYKKRLNSDLIHITGFNGMDKYFISPILACDFIVDKVMWDFDLDDNKFVPEYVNKEHFRIFRYHAMNIFNTKEKCNLIKILYNFVIAYMTNPKEIIIKIHIGIINEYFRNSPKELSMYNCDFSYWFDGIPCDFKNVPLYEL